MSDDNKPLEEILGAKLRARGYTVATAESCTGGLIAHRITNVPGSSEYFCGSLVTYSDQAKIELLGIDPETLRRCGAVSEEVAREMSEKVRTKFSADMSVGVTGIAGPGGGSPEKPVGLVYLSISSVSGTVAIKEHFSGGRAEVKSQTAERALAMLLEHLS